MGLSLSTVPGTERWFGFFGVFFRFFLRVSEITSHLQPTTNAIAASVSCPPHQQAALRPSPPSSEGITCSSLLWLLGWASEQTSLFPIFFTLNQPPSCPPHASPSSSWPHVGVHGPNFRPSLPYSRAVGAECDFFHPWVRLLSPLFVCTHNPY